MGADLTTSNAGTEFEIQLIAQNGTKSSEIREIRDTAKSGIAKIQSTEERQKIIEDFMFYNKTPKIQLASLKGDTNQLIQTSEGKNTNNTKNDTIDVREGFLRDLDEDGSDYDLLSQKDKEALGYYKFIRNISLLLKKASYEDSDILNFWNDYGLQELNMRVIGDYNKADFIENFKEILPTIEIDGKDEAGIKEEIKEAMQVIPRPKEYNYTKEELSMQGISLEMSPKAIKAHVTRFLATPEGKKMTDEVEQLQKEILEIKKQAAVIVKHTEEVIRKSAKIDRQRKKLKSLMKRMNTIIAKANA